MRRNMFLLRHACVPKNHLKVGVFISAPKLIVMHCVPKNDFSLARYYGNEFWCDNKDTGLKRWATFACEGDAGQTCGGPLIDVHIVYYQGGHTERERESSRAHSRRTSLHGPHNKTGGYFLFSSARIRQQSTRSSQEAPRPSPSCGPGAWKSKTSALPPGQATGPGPLPVLF